MAEKEDRAADDQALQRRLKLLKEQFKAGKIHIAEGLNVEKSLEAVRELPDGSIDLSTVDDVVRSFARVAEFAHDRQELKEAIPLEEVQRAYFDFLYANFGEFYEAMIKRGLTPGDVARGLSSDARSRAEFLGPIPEFMNEVVKFWDAAGDAVQAHLEDMHGATRGVFGGDLFPSHDENIASKTGIYLDTIVLPDPFLRSRVLFEKWSDERKVYFLVKHAMNVLQYREIACSDVSPPIVVVLPDLVEVRKDEKQFFFQLGEIDALKHAGVIFGREFSEPKELFEYAKTLVSIEDVVREVRVPSRVLFDADWTGDLAEQIARAAKKEEYRMINEGHPGLIVATQAIGRMSVSNELLIKSRWLRGIPLIDAPTSWQYLAWKLEYDARSAEAELGLTDLHVVRGLQALAQNEMQWLGRVPLAALIETRKTGAIHEIREVLGKGVQDLINVDPRNFHRTADQVFDNIHGAFDKHRAAIDELKAKKWKFAGSDVGTWLAVGTVAVTAAATGLPAWGLAALAATELTNAPKLREIPASIRALATESKRLKQSPVGLLFKMSENRR